MFWLGHTDLLLSSYCLIAAIAACRAEPPQDFHNFHTNRHQVGSYRMLASEESRPAPARPSAGLKFTLAYGAELKPPTVSAADSSPGSSVPADGAAATMSPPPTAADETAPAPAKAPSLIQRLEGREGDAVIWSGIAVLFFVVGWIGGGIHARRRERARRTKLRF